AFVIGNIDKYINQPDIDIDRGRLGKSAKRERTAKHRGKNFHNALISPSAQTSPSSKCSFFQMGTVFLRVSMSQREAAYACARWAEDTAIKTLVSPISSRPRRWTSATWRAPWTAI